MSFIQDGKGICPWCNRAVAFSPRSYQRSVSPHYIVSSGGLGSVSKKQDDEPVRFSLAVYECMYCDRTSIVLGRSFRDAEHGEWSDEDQTLIAPDQAPRTLDPSVPDSICDLFEEASKCENAGALRGAGVLYRACVEDLVQRQGGAGRTLYDKIDSLSASLSEELITDLHEVRLLGNSSIHDGLEFSVDEVADIADLIVEMTVILYVQPEQKRAMREARKARRSQH